MLSNINSIGFEFESNIFPFIKNKTDNMYYPIFPNIEGKSSRYNEKVVTETKIHIIKDESKNLDILVTSDIEEPDKMLKIKKNYRKKGELYENCVLFGKGCSISQQNDKINTEYGYYLHNVYDNHNNYGFVIPLIDISDAKEYLGIRGNIFFLPNYELHSLFNKKIEDYNEIQDYYYYVTEKMWNFIFTMDINIININCGKLIIAKKMVNEKELLFVLHLCDNKYKSPISENTAKKLLYEESIINVQASMCIKYEFTYVLFKQLLKQKDYVCMELLELIEKKYDGENKNFLNFSCLYLYYINIFFYTITEIPSENKKNKYTRQKITFRKKITDIINYFINETTTYEMLTGNLFSYINMVKIHNTNRNLEIYINFVEKFYEKNCSNIDMLTKFDKIFELNIYGNLIECGDSKDSFMFELRNVDEYITLTKFEPELPQDKPQGRIWFVDYEDDVEPVKKKARKGGNYNKYLKYLNKNISNIEI